jgi:hypothetical protein
MDGSALRGHAGSSKASSAWVEHVLVRRWRAGRASPSAVSTLRARWVSTTNAVTV